MLLHHKDYNTLLINKNYSEVYRLIQYLSDLQQFDISFFEESFVVKWRHNFSLKDELLYAKTVLDLIQKATLDHYELRYNILPMLTYSYSYSEQVYGLKSNYTDEDCLTNFSIFIDVENDVKKLIYLSDHRCINPLTGMPTFERQKIDFTQSKVLFNKSKTILNDLLVSNGNFHKNIKNSTSRLDIDLCEFYFSQMSKTYKESETKKTYF